MNDKLKLICLGRGLFLAITGLYFLFDAKCRQTDRSCKLKSVS